MIPVPRWHRTTALAGFGALVGVGTLVAVGAVAGCADTSGPAAVHTLPIRSGGAVAGTDPSAAVSDPGAISAPMVTPGATTTPIGPTAIVVIPNPAMPTIPTGAGGVTTPPATAPAGTIASFPVDARTYAEDMLLAWQHGQRDRLADLVSSAALATLTAHPGTPDQVWMYRSTSAATGAALVTFQDSGGARMTVRVATAVLGHPHAITSVTF